MGNTLNHWMQAKGEPEKILWLAATGAVQTPSKNCNFIVKKNFNISAFLKKSHLL